MNQTPLEKMLQSLTGQLQTMNASDEKKLRELRDQIAKTLPEQDIAGVRNREFLFETSDLKRNIEAELPPNKSVKGKAKAVDSKREEGTLVFMRNVPVRSTQVPGGVSLAATGARVNTFGPFIDIFGLPFWFDFVKVKKLIALYIQGQSLPAILFDATFSKPRFELANAKPVELTKNFTVDPESVWIQTKLFDTNAPADQYVGIRVKGGTITLDVEPTMVAGKLTVPATCKVVSDLKLEQQDKFDTDPTSPYGKDARSAKFDLPEEFKFSFKGNTKNIVKVGEAKWKVFGQDSSFKFIGNQACVYNPFINRLAIPMDCNHDRFSVVHSESSFFKLSGSAVIVNSWWALPSAKIDIANPLEADGNGGLIIGCTDGLFASWQNLQAKMVALGNPFIMGEPGRVSFTDLKSNGQGAFQEFDGWKDAHNPIGTKLECRFKSDALLIYNSLAKGDELILSIADLNMQTDRPVKVNGEAVTVRSKNSSIMLSANKHQHRLMALDDNMLWDHKLPAHKIPRVKPYALAMHNALFTVTPPNNLVLIADCSEDMKRMTQGKLYLGFGLYSYLPTLPDPYAANLGLLRAQFMQSENSLVGASVDVKQKGSKVWMWLIGLVQWELSVEDKVKVGVSFHFAPLVAPLEIEKEKKKSSKQKDASPNEIPISASFHSFISSSNDIVPETAPQAAMLSSAASVSQRVDPLAVFNMTDFALLDVSSKANQMGVAFAKVSNWSQQLVSRKYDINISDDGNATVFPIQMRGLDVITAGINAQAFTVPAIAWEPVFNLTKPALKAGDTDENGVALPPPYDPPIGFNYYQNDGIATRIGNLSQNPVTLSPIPMAKYLVEAYKDGKDKKTYAVFNLPFGMLAFTILNNKSVQDKKPEIHNVKPVFENYVNGGIQLELTAGTSLSPDDSNMFEGFTIQLVNINHADGSSANASTLAGTPTQIFNNEFLTNPDNLPARPGVPLTGAGLSGYGASMFSNWLNKEAMFAQVSQAQFNVITGRTNHEVVQVKSMVYPWGIQVVRTITLFRLANGYVARIDSGWQAQSDGKYDFSWQKPIVDGSGKVTGKTPQPNPYEFHPGIVRGLFKVRNIQEQPKIFKSGSAKLYAVTFDAEVQLENVSEGGQDDRVVSSGVLGYVQIAPAGQPIDLTQMSELLKSENNSIGGPISCVIKVAGTPQRMKLNRFDVNSSVNAANKAIFVSATRGSVIMPKDGSWSMVQHDRKTGDVSPLPEQLSVPLIRAGKWVKDKVVKPADVSNLIRIAHPGDLLKVPDDTTINFGFLQNMGTQKVLFMTPGFKKGVESLLSKTPPLLADSFRLMNSKGIFPNIGNLENNFGQAISMLKGIGAANNPLDAFNKINVPDAGDVFDVLQLKAKEEAGKLLDQGYKLAKGAINGIANDALKFDLPSFDYPLVDLDGKLVIKIQYKAESKPKGQPSKNYVGKFDFDVDSFANDLADTWKGRMNNLAMVVTLGPLTDVMKIKGNFNSQKGKEVDLGSKNASDDPGLNLPLPEIEFSDAVEPVIKILEILASLSSGEYGDALKKGLKVAMSNSANIWEYKFEANKDIPLVRFPPTKALYESPQTPLKLEASLGIGVFFNAALKVTTDPKQLLPTAGAYFKFHGGLQIMCVSVGVGTIYAVGNVDLKLEADTSPKIAVTMKFGFGAQITVGLPVVGNVSVLFMVGVEVYADSSSKVKITAFMLFRGHAELLGGLVSVTITIEAKGSVEKAGPGTPTNCQAQVTFGIDISIFLVINISFSESWEESRQIA